MNNLLYYPGFQINNEEWLKFALLYLKDVNTIVPPEADDYLGATHRFLLAETDLLNSYRPTYEEVSKSTADAVSAISKELKNPVKVFGVLGEIDINDFWRQPYNHNFELFQSKFSYEFEDFCRERGFFSRSENGIMIPYQLGIMYMSFLAHNIGEHNNMAVITDLEEEKKLSSINENAWKYNKKFEEIKFIKKLIELQIPGDLNDIPLRSIVKLRNKNSFQRKLREFHLAVNDLVNLNSNFTEQSLDEVRRSISLTKESLIGDILDLATSLSATTIAVHTVLSNDVGNIERVQEILGYGVLAGTVPQIKDKIQGNWRRSLATRYLTDIKKLKRQYSRINTTF
jgi:hypothetical protein